MAHAPLSSEGHIGIMTDGIPSMNACGHLDQLQVQKLLQFGGWVVCPKGLIGSHKALLFNFEELPVWNMATVDEPTRDLSLIEVDMNSMESEAPPSTRAEDTLSLKGTDLAIHDPMATLFRHPHMWSCQKTSLASSKSVTPITAYHPEKSGGSQYLPHSTVSDSLQR